MSLKHSFKINKHLNKNKLKTKIMSKQTKSTAVAVKGTSNELVGTSMEDALTLLNQKLAELQTVHETKYVGSTKITLGSGSELDITTETDIQVLRRAYASHKAQTAQLAAGDADLMDVMSVPVNTEIDGSTNADMLANVKLRISKLKTEERYAFLQKKRDELKQLLSDEDKKAIIMREIESA